MAFLDNSGDIILDAALTDEGRRRMAQGRSGMQITKFAVADDEINYGQYDKTNSGGVAYYDLEILQTPVFEAQMGSQGLQYGCLSNLPLDTLYMPIAKPNELEPAKEAIITKNNMFHVIDRSKDTANVKISTVLKDNGYKYMLGTAVNNANYILVETGFDVAFGEIPLGTKNNQKDFIISKNLSNKSFLCYYDNRFFQGVMGFVPGGKWANSGRQHSLVSNLKLTSGQRVSRGASGRTHQSVSRLSSVSNQIYNYDEGISTETLYSVLGGVRAEVVGISPIVMTGMSPQYSLFGGTITIGSTSCVYIDTSIEINGATTGVSYSAPIRIIRVA
tara:strand:- start:4136 stop:5131 length:996 start_codon:yes stop_codon:yes gene_type:complete